jgi:type II secretory pathway component GspD/PulD (secretin)
MKMLKLTLLSLALTWALLATTAAQQAEPPAEDSWPADTEEIAPLTEAPDEQGAAEPQRFEQPEPAEGLDQNGPLEEPIPFVEDELAPLDQAPPAEPRAIQPSRPSTEPRTRTAPRSSPSTQPNLPVTASARLENGKLRLNFRNAPLDMVLNHLSEAAGFIIVLETEVKGRVNVWSNQPVTQEEALDLLNSVLNHNGYAAIRNERTLTIVSKDDAKRRDLPVRMGSDPARIPRSDEMVTQILPVRYINAAQVSRDLQPLLPESATMTANEGGNALVITDTQTSIRRLAEIVRALDTALSSVSAVRVFQLEYADARALANVIRELFQPQDTRAAGGQAQGQAARIMNMFQGRGPGGGPGGQQAGGASATGGRAPTPRVVAVAEERSNSLVVSAPEEQMPIIEDLIREVDTNVEDITELRVFRLLYADAQETADLLMSLFPDPNTTQGGRQTQQGGRFAGFTGAAPRTTTAANPNQTARTLKQTRVLAVPDLRTRSIIVSAARDLMTQIAQVIDELDSDPARKQQVFVFDVENTDPQAMQQILQGLFPSQNYGTGAGANRQNTTRQTGNQLNNRATQMQNRQPGGGANTGFGTGGNIGGATGGRTGR